MTVPSDARLPGGGGQSLTYYNIIPTKFGQTQNNYTLADKFGNEYEHWNGFDISVNGTARERSPVPGRDRHRANRRPTTATSSRSYPKC